jgi:ubiquinone/menaquinone biosynthesis C-methylase UbiE|tara:strand:- start:226 stop:810 length:585 start_codon:yes stop_codon:yes gene_type:complete
MSSESDPMTTQDFIRRLLAPERAQDLDTFAVLTFSGINLHDTVADIGCGPGFFTVPLAKYLVNGNLYALDIDNEMLAACRESVAQARLGNVEVLKCGEFDFPLDPGSLNGAFLAFMIHHSPDKARLLGAVRELIHPRGWCTILEWYRKETEEGPPLERRLDPAEMEALATQAGFSHRGWRDLNGDQYMMMLRRP